MRRWVQTGDITGAQLAELRTGGAPVAWDIETSGLDWKNDQIATCQVHNGSVGTLIVQVDGTRPENLSALLEDPGVVKVFHHAPFDLRFMTHHWDVSPARVGCTKVASRLLNPAKAGSAYSLQSLLLEYLDVVISKEQRTSDWRASELSVAQIEYAARDVEYLLPLHATLMRLLGEMDRLEHYRKCCDFLPTHVLLQTLGWEDVFAY